MSVRVYQISSSWMDFSEFYIGSSNKIFRETPDLVPTWQKYWALYIKVQVLLHFWQQKEISCSSTPVQRKPILVFPWKNITGFVLSIATMYANNDTKWRRCCFNLQQWLHERVTLCVTRTLPILSVPMRVTNVTPGGTCGAHISYNCCHCSAAPHGPRIQRRWRFEIIHRHTTLGRTPLDEWSAVAETSINNHYTDKR